MKFQAHRENAVVSSPTLSQFQSAPAADYNSKTPLADRAFALFALILTAPLLLVLSACILIGGQVPIFVQDRVGYNGDLFKIFKFQTFPRNGWEAAERAAAQSLIKRVQLFVFRQVSRVLRATGLDELPQFANIVIGDMQIIGPRPLVESDFNALPAGREVRCVVRPGITGLAQVNGGQQLDSESKLALDLYVIDHLSFRITAKIILRTALRILGVTSATASISKEDVDRAKAHMAQRMRGAAIHLPKRTEHVSLIPHPQHDWLVAPSNALRPLRFSTSHAATDHLSRVRSR